MSRRTILKSRTYVDNKGKFGNEYSLPMESATMSEVETASVMMVKQINAALNFARSPVCVRFWNLTTNQEVEWTPNA